MPLTLQFEVSTSVDTEELGSCIELSARNVLDDAELLKIARMVKQRTDSTFEILRDSETVLNSKQIDN